MVMIGWLLNTKHLDLKTLSSGPAARSAPKNFSTESEKFSGAAPPHVTRGIEGFEIQVYVSWLFIVPCIT